MSDEKQEPTQKTRKGYGILIPTRESCMRVLRKVGKGSTARRPDK